MGLGEWLYPSLCQCGQIGNGVLCQECLTNLPRLTPHCYYCQATSRQGVTHDRCRHERTPVRQCVIPYRFSPGIKHLIHQLKYHQNRSMQTTLRALWPPVATADLPARLCLLPVPLHPRRQRERGFNQAEILADALGWVLKTSGHDVLIASTALVRTRYTRPQARLAATDRPANLREAFQLTPHTVQCFHNRTTVIVDDVVSSGTTANEVARALQAATVNIIVCALARG